MKTASLQIGKWLNEELRPNCFATVTFKQCKHHGQGVREWINRDIADSTCNELMQRCTKKFKKLVTGSDPNPFQWVTFSEDGKGSKRLHAHLAIHTSDLIAYDEFSTIFRDLCARFDWVDDRMRSPRKVGIDSTRSWALVPRHRGQPFHAKVGSLV